MTDIEWTDETWNPIVGCSRVSPGCEHCYAERFVHRGMSAQHRGLTVLGKGEKGPRWTGEVRLVESALEKPLHWRKPRRVFVNSLSDLFHDALSIDAIARVFAIMQACPHLTFQVLTKRPARMREVLCGEGLLNFAAIVADHGEHLAAVKGWCHAHSDAPWPLPNVWLGVTAEDQQRADERIPLLLDTPAAVRFVSYEPALGPVDIRPYLYIRDREALAKRQAARGYRVTGDGLERGPGIDWLIVGGESGPGARRFDVTWMRDVLRACRAAGVPTFAKQLGAHVTTRNDDNFTIEEDPPDPDFPHWPTHLAQEDRVGPSDAYQGAPVRLRLRHGKGADMSEWRSDLRVREFPR